MTHAPSPPPEQTLMQLLMGKFMARSVGLVAELGLADHLRDGPRGVDALAAATGSHPRALYRVMRALAGLGLFVESPARTFALTPLSQALRSDAPNSMRGMARWLGGEPGNWRAWGELHRSVQTGEPAIADVFEYFAADPVAGEIFDAAMSSFTRTTAEAVASAYDFSVFGDVVDVGGGLGTLLLTIRAAYPSVRATLFDRPQVIERAAAALAAEGQTEQLQLVAGSFFTALPAADAYVLKHIIHDWSDELAVKILERCRDGLRPGGRVLLVEQLISDGPQDEPARWVDLEMLVMTPGGQERTAAEYEDLCARAGLALTRVLPTPSHVAIVEAERR